MATASYARSDAKLFPLTQTNGLNAEDRQFLLLLGKCVRELREQRGMTRKFLAQQADISERYLGQLESGDGNVSIILLRHIAVALRVPLHELLALDQNASVSQRRQIALIGLRGAGKTTLGNLLAQSIQAPFIELDQEIERDTGLPLSEIF